VDSFSIVPIGPYAASANFHQPRDTTLAEVKTKLVISTIHVLGAQLTAPAIPRQNHRASIG
jgi:hypothetical protein